MDIKPKLCLLLAVQAIVACDTTPDGMEPSRAMSSADSCTSETPKFTVEESAEGVPVLRNHCPELVLGWEVSEEPLLQLGSIDGDSTGLFGGALNQGKKTVRQSDGGIVVLDRQGIRYFSSTGEHLRTVGGIGEGPGEYLVPDGFILLPADTLAIFDRALRRLTTLDPEGRVVSTLNFEGTIEDGGVTDLARLFDGSYVGRAGGYGLSPVAGSFTPDGWVWRYSANGEPIMRIVRWKGPRSYAPRPGSRFSIPFSYSDFTGLWNGSILVGDRESWTFTTFAIDGSVERVMRKEVPLIPISNSEWEEAIRQERSIDGQVDRPNNHPTFGPALVDRVGNLWVGIHEIEFADRAYSIRKAGTWSVFASDGKWITDVRMPGDLSVMEIGEDYVLGVATDELGVHYVRMYSLRKG